MVLCLVTSTDLLTRRAGLSASAELIGTNVYKRFYRATLCLGVKKNLLFPETRPTLAFTPRP